jgi:hypothetical protein
MDISQFWPWFATQTGHWKTATPAAIADSLQATLQRVDSRLGVEIACDDSGHEVIVTAGGDPAAFPVAKAVVQAAPSIRGWTFLALKPPRGFEFTIGLNNAQLSASDLKFEPLESPQRPDQLGIRVYLPPPLPDKQQANEMIWLIVETGIGEEAATRIAFLDVAPLDKPHGELLPISDLAAYVSWYSRRQ